MFNILKGSLSTISFKAPVNYSYIKNITFISLKNRFSNVAPVRSIDVNTNIVKDVILFKYENPRFFKIVNAFAISQFVFWTYLGNFAFTSLRDAPVDKSKISSSDPWYSKINLGSNMYRNGLTTMCIILGFGVLASSWLYTLRSVRYIILHKGGKDVTFVIYTPFGQNRLMKVDLQYVSCQQTRGSSRVQLPIKIKNKSFYYMLDMRGEFRNTVLFDNTAGLHRGF